MKKILILFIAMCVLSACVPVASVIPVPSELQLLIRWALEIALTFVLTQLAKQGLDFTGYKVQILAAVFGAVMVVIDALLAKIPLQWESLTGALLNLFVVVLASYGVHAVYKAFKR